MTDEAGNATDIGRRTLLQKAGAAVVTGLVAARQSTHGPRRRTPTATTRRSARGSRASSISG
jgi:hypothetical protein